MYLFGQVLIVHRDHYLHVVAKNYASALMDYTYRGEEMSLAFVRS